MSPNARLASSDSSLLLNLGFVILHYLLILRNFKQNFENIFPAFLIVLSRRDTLNDLAYRYFTGF